MTQAFQATIGSGRRYHAVIANDLPRDRERQVYRTACGQLIGGGSVYRVPFGRPDGALDNCQRCVTVLATEETKQES